MTAARRCGEITGVYQDGNGVRFPWPVGRGPIEAQGVVGVL